MIDLKNKKVLLMGLGILGGGVATAKWFLKQGADLTVTDTRDENHLKPSLIKLKEFEAKIKYVLGKHDEKDFLENEIIVINPDVPASSPFVEFARKNGKQIENELTLFYKFSPSKNIVAITGTRGKTTTSSWAHHFLKSEYLGAHLLGNSPEKPFLQEIEKVNENDWIVMEVPSYHLEIVNQNNFKPRVALITNLYRDHINRHKSMEEYAATKANIFIGQSEEDCLVLNKEDEWTEFFLNKKPKSRVIFTSEIKQTFQHSQEYKNVEVWGKHNVQNFLAAASAASCVGISIENIKNAIMTLPQIKYREEKVFENEKLQICNDTAATSPEATIAALERFSDQKENLILIAGGTDKELDFKNFAEAVKKNLKSENLILLSGSATEKIKKELEWESFNEFDSLEECLKKALEMATKREDKSVILFSPGAKSFEKFKNEFDRGEQFNLLIQKLLK